MTRTFYFRATLPLIGLAAFVVAASCSPTATSPTGDGDSGGDGDSAGDGDTSGDGDIVLTGDGDGDVGDGDGGREPECTIDETGNKSCVCIKVATWGALGAYGAVPGMDGTDAITAWLNSNSTGEADYFATKPAITAEFLAAYDVIILQDLSGWPAFTPDEIAAFDAWISTARGELPGGGVISLNGYSANGSEMTNVNTLLASTGMSYVPNSDTSGNNTGVMCAYCYGNSVPQAGWTDHPITLNLTQVGAFHGRSITPGDAQIVAQTADGVVGAAKQMGAGRVFMFHDEWVTYNSQWTGEGITGAESCHDDPNNTCYGHGPAEQYSSAQFWYNSLIWAASDPTCFEIEDPNIIVK